MEEQNNEQTSVETKPENEVQYDEIQKVEQVERTDSYFDGKVLEWLGYRIRYYRKQQKLTLRELGEKCGFMNRGDVRIAQYENGSRTPKTGT